MTDNWKATLGPIVSGVLARLRSGGPLTDAECARFYRPLVRELVARRTSPAEIEKIIAAVHAETTATAAKLGPLHRDPNDRLFSAYVTSGGAALADVPAKDYGNYFAPKEDGSFPADLHFRFGLNAKQFADATGCRMRASYDKDGEERWSWVPREKPAATFAAGPTLGPVRAVATSALWTDPARFQFRRGHDSADGTVRDLPTAKYDPAKSPPLIAWHDPETRRDNVIDGHHRFAWAERDGASSVPVQFVNAGSAEEAKAFGERLNREHDAIPFADKVNEDDDAAMFTLDDVNTFAAHKDGESWQTNGRWYKREGGKTFRIPDPSAKKPEPKVKVDFLETAAKIHDHLDGDAAKLTPKTIGVMKAHLDTLTKDQIIAIKKAHDLKGGKTKAEHIAKLLEKAKKLKKEDLAKKKAAKAKPEATAIPSAAGPEGPVAPPSPSVPAKPNKDSASTAVKNAFANPASASAVALEANLKSLSKTDVEAVAKDVGAWIQPTKEKTIVKLLGPFKTKQWAAGHDAKQAIANKTAGGKPSQDFEKVSENDFFEKSKPSAKWKAENLHATPEAIKDEAVTGVPNPALPDETRPPVPDKKTAVAINNYTWGYDRLMNAALRETGAPPTGEFGGNQFTGKPNKDGQGMFAALQKAFAGTKPFAPPPIAVYRGVQSLPAELVNNMEAAALKAKGTGGVVTMPGFISTSTDESTAKDFTGPVSFTIHATQGLDVRGYSHFPGESELLLNHNCGYKVKGVKRTGGKIHIELEQVSGGLPSAGEIALDGKKYSQDAGSQSQPVARDYFAEQTANPKSRFWGDVDEGAAWTKAMEGAKPEEAPPAEPKNDEAKP
jgi:hypothetical protein